jgi:asparagine synthase (glutamine-hydrolysing)
MCGLCGFVMQRNQNRSDWASVLRNMTNTMAHRGPDREAYRTFEEGETIVALGHRRLTIIDITERGNQPISNEDDSLFIVYNGEIYNYRQLGDKLRHLGHRFKSDSDTEVILHLYEEKGLGCIDELRGMFAFALWDRNRSQLLLVRDRIGVKPLFYAPLDNGIVFASEIKSILLHPSIHAALDPYALDSYLTLGYVPGPRSIFKDINALLPGQRLLWSEGALEASHYWEPSFLEPVLAGKEDDLVDELDSLLNDSVRHHLVSDVPVGAFLSGGIDSSLVTAIAQKQSLEPLETFTIGFSEGHDERVFARTVAQHIGSHHHEELAEPGLAKLLPRLVWHLEQPLFDNSVLPTFLVSKLASMKGKVVLSGDGGDEIFVGYDWTRFALILPRVPIKWEPENWEWLYESGNWGFFKRLIYDLGHAPSFRYLRRMTTSALFRNWLYTKEFFSNLEADPTRYLIDSLRGAPVREESERFLYCDLRTYLPEDVLFKVDRMSMAHSLEVRVPLLDHRLLEWLFRLPFDMRFRRGCGKYLLRKVAARYLPPSILKPRKQGFTIPVGAWLRGPLGTTAEALFSSEAFAARRIVSPEKALLLLEMHRRGNHELGHRIWSLIVLEVWARIWLDGQSYNFSLEQMAREDHD